MSARRIVAGFLALALSGCMVMGPDYQRPSAPVPENFREGGEGWKRAEPRDGAERGPWWAVFGDPLLNSLISQVAVSNQNLKSLEAAYRQARAVLDQAEAGFWPSFTASASDTRASQRSSTTSTPGPRRTTTTYALSATASWEPDLWGRIRRTVEGDVAKIEASYADLAAAKLSAQATFASNYVALRVADELKRLLDATVEAYTRALQITRSRHQAGTAARADVASAEAQLESTRAQSIAVGVQRAQLEHAMAILIGKTPSEFTLPAAATAFHLPTIPAAVPSTLLERRPDIAAAERRVAAANAQIGVAEAAYFPDLSLTGSYGFQSSSLGSLVEAPSRVWSVGPKLTGSLFDFGLRAAQVEAAKAAHDQSVAQYRQTVLSAFQQVEDQLSTLRVLAQQAEVQAGAVRAAQEAERLTLNQYLAGTVAYTSVVTAQALALNNSQSALSITQSRFAATIALIQALGGGWEGLPKTPGP